MGVTAMLTSQFGQFWRFLGFFQPPALRLLHACVVSLVALQVLTRLAGLSMTHAILGLVLCMLGLGLIALALGTRGLRHYYPYLWGDMGQITKDVAAIRGGKLIIAPRPKGLACVVQGLGMGALAMSQISGLWLFRSWQMGEISHTAANLHGLFVLLLLAYALGHGGMALGHFFFWKKTAAKKQ